MHIISNWLHSNLIDTEVQRQLVWLEIYIVLLASRWGNTTDIDRTSIDLSTTHFVEINGNLFRCIHILVIQFNMNFHSNLVGSQQLVLKAGNLYCASSRWETLLILALSVYTSLQFILLKYLEIYLISYMSYNNPIYNFIQIWMTGKHRGNWF